MQEFSHLEKSKNLSGFFFGFSWAGGTQKGAEHHIFQHSKVAQRLHNLEGASDAASGGAVRSQSRDVLPMEMNAAAVRVIHTGDQIK